MAHGFELRLQGFDVHKIFVEQIVMNKGPNIRQRTERKTFDNLRGESIFELTKPVEQMHTVIFDFGKDARARIGEQ